MFFLDNQFSFAFIHCTGKKYPVTEISLKVFVILDNNLFSAGGQLRLAFRTEINLCDLIFSAKNPKQNKMWYDNVCLEREHTGNTQNIVWSILL